MMKSILIPLLHHGHKGGVVADLCVPQRAAKEEAREFIEIDLQDLESQSSAHSPANRLRVNVFRRPAVHDDQVMVPGGRVPERVLGSLQVPAQRRLSIDPLTGIQQALVDTVRFVEHQQHLTKSITR